MSWREPLGAAMRRRNFIAGLGGLVATWPMVVAAQKKIAQVGILDPAIPHQFEAFRAAAPDTA